MFTNEAGRFWLVEFRNSCACRWSVAATHDDWYSPVIRKMLDAGGKKHGTPCYVDIEDALAALYYYRAKIKHDGPSAAEVRLVTVDYTQRFTPVEDEQKAAEPRS